VFQDSVTRMAETGRQAIEDELDDLLRLHGEDAGELLLVRHAEAAHTQGSDPMLSCTGLEQAERLAARLNDTWFEAIYSAPERRAQQTARVVASICGRTLHVLDGLADIEFDVTKTAPGESPRGYADRFAEMPRWDNLPGFECGRQFRRRAVQAVERVLSINPARRVVLVTHASVINAYLSMLLCVPADQFFTAEYTSLSIVRWREGQYALRCLNDSSHLSPTFGIAVESELFTLRSWPLTSR
jgi:probable phosphoglycerate mutase